MKGERAIQDYVDAVIERDSYLPREGEEQTEARASKLKQAVAHLKICYSRLNGSQIGETRRRLAYFKAMAEGAAKLEESEHDEGGEA